MSNWRQKEYELQKLISELQKEQTAMILKSRNLPLKSYGEDISSYLKRKNYE